MTETRSKLTPPPTDARMTEPSAPLRRRPETDTMLVDRARGKAERVVLGNSPFGSMVRIVAAALLFVVIFGTIFFLAQ